jgi:hypothetical protein
MKLATYVRAQGFWQPLTSPVTMRYLWRPLLNEPFNSSSHSSARTTEQTIDHFNYEFSGNTATQLEMEGFL